MGSWVTMTMVWPISSTARRMKVSTSAPARESRFPVGSSAKMISGRLASARATATRCCWPPDISCGRCFSLLPMFRVSMILAIQSWSPLWPASSSGRVMFSAAVMVGTRLNDWNTKPTWSRRSLVSCWSLRVLRSASPMYAFPEVRVSRPAAQCSSVDFPDPDGPMMAVYRPAMNSTVTASSARTSTCPLP